MTRLVHVCALALFTLALSCTGRTPVAAISPGTATSSNPVDAGRADTGLPVDAGPQDDTYGACSDLLDCPSDAVRCTIERSGVCSPACDAQGSCPSIDGKVGICVGDGSLEWCVLICGEDPDCPNGFVCTRAGTCVRQ